MCSVKADAVVIIVSLISLTFVYRIKCDDNGKNFLLREYDELDDNDTWWMKEDRLFAVSGICSSTNRSYVDTCSSSVIVDNLHALRRSQCFCDDACHLYHDCCINYVLNEDRYARNWSCREVKGQHHFRFPIYVYQKCPLTWEDNYTKRLCEVESSVLEKNREHFSYLQDVPVKKENNGLFYRNVFCAMCNGVSDFVKWKSYFYCPANMSDNVFSLNVLDFSNSYYNTRSQNFRNVKIGSKITNCRLVIEDFDRYSLLKKYNARLCKPVIDTCVPNSDELSKYGCEAYTSFVYETALPSSNRKVYKNFHCALCNNAKVGKIRCLDPFFPTISTGDSPAVSTSLSFLFDFNFEGNDNQVGYITPCKLKDGKVWDPILQQCINFTCGKLFERKEDLCVPRVTDNSVGGLNSSCPKRIIKHNGFYIFENKSVYINDSRVLLSENEYEAYDFDDGNVISIAICADEGTFLLHLSKVQYFLTEITLSLSMICLVLHLIVYSVLQDLRNCPGKILMSLSSCLLCGHFFLLTGQHLKSFYWMCYVCSVLMHFGYLSSFLWMNVMSYDIYRTFSITQSRNMKQKKTFIKYSLYCWVTSLVMTVISVLFDNFLSQDNGYRPKYGNPICWFNQRKGVLLFFVLPIFLLLLTNAIFFIVSAFRINKISQQTKMVNNFSDKVRYFLYIKLSVVFGLTWIVGILAGTLRVDFLWYPFIVLNGLQGVFIFISFTVKRKIIKMLLVKFKIHSDKYKIQKDTSSGIKRTMYSSLSNLSTLQTTLTVHLPAFNDNPEILKAVRKLNPDILVNEKKL